MSFARSDNTTTFHFWRMAMNAFIYGMHLIERFGFIKRVSMYINKFDLKIFFNGNIECCYSLP